MKTSEQILDMYYLDARCVLIEVAALLDRYDRGSSSSGESNGKSRPPAEQDSDPRLAQIYQTLQYLGNSENASDRSEHVLNLFTDND